MHTNYVLGACLLYSISIDYSKAEFKVNELQTHLHWLTYIDDIVNALLDNLIALI